MDVHRPYVWTAAASQLYPFLIRRNRVKAYQFAENKLCILLVKGPDNLSFYYFQLGWVPALTGAS